MFGVHRLSAGCRACPPEPPRSAAQLPRVARSSLEGPCFRTRPKFWCATPRTHSLCSSDAERGTFIAGWTYNQCMWGSTERGCREKASTVGEMSSRIAQRDFGKRFERGKLTFTGDVLQVISVSGRQQKFGKLLKRLTVGA